MENMQECISRTETEAAGQEDAIPVRADAESAGTEDKEQRMAEIEDASVESTVENRADQEILCFCVRVAGGGGQSDTTLNFQSNQRLKSGKIVFIGDSGVSAGSFPQKVSNAHMEDFCQSKQLFHPDVIQTALYMRVGPTGYFDPLKRKVLKEMEPA